MDASIAALIDRQAIADLSAKYMRALDRLDLDLLRSVYWCDATDARGFINGNAHDFCAFAIELLTEHQANHHMIGQTLIELAGDVAFGEVYFQAYHRIERDGEGRDFWVIGRYVDRYERREGIWKIAHRAELNDACSDHPATDDWFRTTPQGLRGARGQGDLSYNRHLLKLD